MCGIAGILYRDWERPVSPELLGRLGSALAHRGPDGEGVFRGPGVGLVQRRLAILELATGTQPLANEDGSLQVVCDGQIYNYRELRASLEAQGHCFGSGSDAEVLVHLYEQEGLGFLDRLRGMFALALWDQRQRRLLLARDRIGLKPLYYYRDAEKLLFASELKGIRAAGGLGLTVDPTALADYVAWGTASGEKSPFVQVKKLPPGHWLWVGPEHWEASAQRWWQFRIRPPERRTVEEWQEVLQAKLTETVALHWTAEVPVGAFLSGGVDSCVVVGLQSRLDSTPVRTFTVDFSESGFGEGTYARQAAQHFHTQHVEQRITAEAAESLEELVRVYDEPFADPSALATWCLSRLARQEVKVVLSGDGGDEAFGGYLRYQHDVWEAGLRRWIPGWLARTVLARLARLWPKADWLPRPLRWKTTLTNLSLDPAEAYAHSVRLCRPPWSERLLAPLAHELADYRPEQPLIAAYRAASSEDPLACMMAVDVQFLLPDLFLTKVDRASMAVGLEVRAPLVDHQLLEWAAGIPSELKLRAGQTKWLFRKTFEQLLPPGLAWRPKHGFDLPVGAWLRGPLQARFTELLLRPGAGIQEWISRPALARLWSAHQRGAGQHGPLLWALLVLATWKQTLGD